MRRLDLIVGSNGAGKTTFVAFFLAPTLPSSVFVNADEIARDRWPDDQAAHAYDAARIAQQTRDALIARGDSFIAETVFSHPSKVQLVRDALAAEYTVVLHAIMVPEELAVLRVPARVRAGGHHVPEAKIRERYQRLWPNVAQAARLVHSATFYDNSHSRGPRKVAEFTAGMPTGPATWPAWTPEALLGLGGAL